MREKLVSDDVMLIVNDFWAFRKIIDSDTLSHNIKKDIKEYFDLYAKELPQDKMKQARELIIKEAK